MQKLRVTAGHVTVETAVPGGRAHVDVFRGAFLPDDVPQEQRETELRLGTVEWVDVDEPGEPSNVDADDGVEGDPNPPEPLVLPEGMSVATTLEWVGDDLDKARVAITAEVIKEEFARATLVERLQKLITAGEAAAAEAAEREGAGSDENSGAGPSVDS